MSVFILRFYFHRKGGSKKMEMDTQCSVDLKIKSHLNKLGVIKNLFDYYDIFYGSFCDAEMEEDFDSLVEYVVDKNNWE